MYYLIYNTHKYFDNQMIYKYIFRKNCAIQNKNPKDYKYKKKIVEYKFFFLDKIKRK